MFFIIGSDINITFEYFFPVNFTFIPNFIHISWHKIINNNKYLPFSQKTPQTPLPQNFDKKTDFGYSWFLIFFYLAYIFSSSGSDLYFMRFCSFNSVLNKLNILVIPGLNKLNYGMGKCLTSCNICYASFSLIWFSLMEHWLD